MISCAITSLHDPESLLSIETGEGSQLGDIFINSRMEFFSFSAVQLIMPGRGTGNMDYTCPLVTAMRGVLMMEKQKDLTLLQTQPVNAAQLFAFNAEDIIVYTLPKDLPAVGKQRLEFIQSSAGFFGLRTSNRMGLENSLTDPDNIIWLCGPDNKQYAAMFGRDAYNKRRKLFGKLFSTAAASKMSNPIFPGDTQYITKGNHYVIN